jgi:methylenetetrahydrofolate dehydrogenase (NADP+) / methenyltetrahydrofolate cyclohydrolase
VRNKSRACERAGVRSERVTLRADVGAAEVLREIHRLNADPEIHGILVQLPLPPGHDVGAVIDAIAPGKDVDGFGSAQMGALAAGRPCLAPCTPTGIVALLDSYAIGIEGRHVVIVGRSAVVGKPLALMMITRRATVTVCTSRTVQLREHTRRADLLIVAAGSPGLVTGDMVRRGATVIDVGIHRLADGRLVGDVDYAGASAVASHITPVPGGVGPMTVASLVANTVSAAENAHARACTSINELH